MKILLTTLSLLAFVTSACASETIGEKTKAEVNNVKRDAKQQVNRAEEKACKISYNTCVIKAENNEALVDTCDQTYRSCLKQKVDNRAQETKDYITDKANQGKNKIDSTGARD